MVLKQRGSSPGAGGPNYLILWSYSPFYFNLNRWVCLLISSSYWATSLDVLRAACSRIIPPHHLVTGFTKDMQIAQVPCTHQDSQGSQEPGGTLGLSVVSEGFTRGLGEIMQVNPLDPTQPLT